MFSRLNGLLNNNIFFVSRQKVLLRRRKMTSKKQKVAKKKFLQHNPGGNFTNELKILQIQKQLDRKLSKNYHLNELMDELFYPDVRYANQKILEQNLLKMTANNEENGSKYKKLKNLSQQQEMQGQMEEYDELVEQIYLCQIPSQLFELYLKNTEIFNHDHLMMLLDRLQFYFKNKAAIQERITQKWKQSLDKLKLTDPQKKKRKRCPFIFIQQDEIIRDEDWNKVIKDIQKKIIFTTEMISNQQIDQDVQVSETNINSDQKPQQSVDQSYFSLQNNCELVLKIKDAAKYIPEQLFDTITKKTLAIVSMNKKMDKTQEKLPIFSHQQKVKLLRVLALKSQTKSTLTKSVHIEQPEQSEKEQEKIIAIGKKICEDVLKSSKCTAEDLGAIMRSDKGHYKFLNSMLLDLAKGKIIQFLSSTNLERSIDYLQAFWMNGTCKDSQFIQILVFDIYRKLPFSFSKTHLFFLLTMIKQSHISFRQSQTQINVSSIYPRIAQTLTNYLNRNDLTHQQIKTFLTSIYENYPLYKQQNKLNILQMITTSVVKMGMGYKLEELAHILLKTTILGYRSKVLSRYLFERYRKEYRKLIKQYKSQRIQLITDKNLKNLTEDQEIQEVPSMNQVLLEETLVMMLWSYVASFGSPSSLPLSDMIQIYPLHIRSQDPMILDFIDDLNQQLGELKYFPQIKKGVVSQTKTKDGRKSSKNLSFMMKTNTCENYRYLVKESLALELLEVLQTQKQPITVQTAEILTNYLIRYYLVSQKRLPQDFKVPDRWNDSLIHVYTNKLDTYEKIKELFLSSCKELNEDNQKPTFRERVLKVLQKSNQKLSKQKLTQQKIIDVQGKSFKLYDLL